MASSLHSVREAKEIWGSPPPLRNLRPQGDLFPLEPGSEAELPRDSIEAVIIRRGSSRRFRRAWITYRRFSTILDQAARGMPADFLVAPGDIRRADPVPGLNLLYLIVQDVEDLPS